MSKCLAPGLFGSSGLLGLYNCLARDAGTREIDCSSKSQHSTSGSELTKTSVDAFEASFFLARALRFPTNCQW